MAETKIQWADYTFNPWSGCTKVAPGCAHCYAEADQDHRRGRVKWGVNGTRLRTSDGYWKQPLKWNRAAEKAGERRRVFTASLADVFEQWDGPIVDAHGRKLFKGNNDYLYQAGPLEPGLPALTMDDLRRDLFALIDQTPWLDWLLLTKRPENVRRMWPALDVPEYNQQFRSNVWLGTSVSDQLTADQSVPELLKCRDLCPILFLSAEPLLGPVHLDAHMNNKRGWFANVDSLECAGKTYPKRGDIDWCIIGGESGPRARPCDVAWVRSLVDQCRKAGVPAFVKQLGSKPFSIADHISHRGDESKKPNGFYRFLNDPKGGAIEEWPEWARVREFPATEQPHG